MNGEGEDSGVSKNDLLRLSTDIVASYVSQNVVSTTGLQDLIAQVYGALARLEHGGGDAAQPAVKQKPAVPISRSVQHDYIVCLEDGKPLKMLKRYLRSRYNMSPEDYRRKWEIGRAHV